MGMQEGRKKCIYVSFKPQRSKSRIVVVMTSKTDPCCVDDSFKGYSNQHTDCLEKYALQVFERMIGNR